VINAPESEGQRWLDLLPKSRNVSPRRVSPAQGSPKRQTSPKRKLTEEVETDTTSRPAKRAAIAETVDSVEEPKPVKLNSFGFGKKITGSPWAIPAPEQSSTKSLPAQPKKVSLSFVTC
jgi:hypothetical protein